MKQNPVLKIALNLTKFFFLFFLVQPLLGSSPALLDGPKLDFYRLEEGGIAHLQLRCYRGLAADPNLHCSVKKIKDNEVLLKAKFSEDTLKKSLELFFQAVPKSLIFDQEPQLARIPGSPLHWKISDQTRHVTGAFLLGEPNPLIADIQERYERAALALEFELEAAFSPH